MGDVEAMIAGFRAYQKVVSSTLDEVHALLSAGRYNEATAVMTTLTQRQAQTSTSMRAVLLRSGHLEVKE